MKNNAPVKIKICGLTRLCDIMAVNEAGPDYIGFVFAPGRRRVTPKQALEMRKVLSPGISPVGVFVNDSPDRILSIVREGIIDVIQLHGDESEENIAFLKALTGKIVIKAVAPLNTDDVLRHAGSSADYLLFDNGKGGTGHTFAWDLIADVDRPYFLAGGLCAGNVEEALRRTLPFALDISSGVETGGVKDPEKIISVIRRIRYDKQY